MNKDMVKISYLPVWAFYRTRDYAHWWRIVRHSIRPCPWRSAQLLSSFCYLVQIYSNQAPISTANDSPIFGGKRFTNLRLQTIHQSSVASDSPTFATNNSWGKYLSRDKRKTLVHIRAVDGALAELMRSAYWCMHVIKCIRLWMYASGYKNQTWALLDIRSWYYMQNSHLLHWICSHENLGLNPDRCGPPLYELPTFILASTTPASLRIRRSIK